MIGVKGITLPEQEDHRSIKGFPLVSSNVPRQFGGGETLSPPGKLPPNHALAAMVVESVDPDCQEGEIEFFQGVAIPDQVICIQRFSGTGHYPLLCAPVNPALPLMARVAMDISAEVTISVQLLPIPS